MQIVVCVYCIFFPNEVEELDLVVGRKKLKRHGQPCQEQWNGYSLQLCGALQGRAPSPVFAVLPVPEAERCLLKLLVKS